MLHRRLKFLGFVFICASAAVVIWWVVSAGPMTVYRTIVHNFSDIDDHRIFPRRKLTAPAQAFRFRENIDPDYGSLRVVIGERRDITLAEFLEKSETTAFLVVKDDVMVFEKYYLGYDRATPSFSFSIAKSVLSMLIGCALDDGYLISVDQPTTDFVPEMAENGFKAVTLKHLLQMTSGIDYAENDLPLGLHVRFYYTDRLEEEILRFRLQEPPGRRFVYRSSDAFLLTLALKRALRGKTVTEYTQERIWNPLGMEHDGAWSVDHPGDGLEKTGCCLSATARDFAKFGRLYLNKGLWNGRRVVSEDWVRESTRFDTSAGSAWDHQYMWWLVSQDRPDFMAIGHLGQFLYINPSTRVIIVRLGKSMGGLSRKEWQKALMTLSDTVR